MLYSATQITAQQCVHLLCITSSRGGGGHIFFKQTVRPIHTIISGNRDEKQQIGSDGWNGEAERRGGGEDMLVS